MAGLSVDLPRPEPNRVRDPAFSAGTDAEPEAMTDAGILVIFHLGPRSPQRRHPSFHGGGRCDSIGIPDSNERGRLRWSEVRVARVQSHHGRWLGQVGA